MEIASNSMSCAVGPCGVGVVTEGQGLIGMGTYAAQDATVSLTPGGEITAGQPVQVDLAGLAPGRNYTIRACHPNIAANAFLANSCATSPDDAAVVAGADGTATATLVPPWTVDAGGAVTSCQAYYCTLGAVLDGTDWVVGSGGYGFAQPTATLTPDTGLVDGEAVTLTVEGLRPGGRFHLRLCPMATVLSRYGTTDCAVGADDPALVPGPDGTATATIAVSQRIVAPNGREHVCRDEVCAVAVVDDELDQVPAGVAYALAQARLTATPDSGLSDGDTVTLSGAGVMASYAGPTLWIFPTGRWSLGQCAATVADDVTIGGVFSTCAPLPGAEPLHVPGSTFEAEVTVRAEVDPVLGGPVDCTTAPGACVLALARIESDGTVTVHTTPVTFD
jgi:hypothetical protein